MRKVATYAFQAFVRSPDSCEEKLEEVTSKVGAWLTSKGKLVNDGDESKVVYHRDGRVANLKKTEVESTKGRWKQWWLSEPHDSGQFNTVLDIASSGNQLHVACTLLLGNPETRVSPVRFDVHCPKVIRNILDLSMPWTVNTTPVMPGRVRVREGEATELAGLIRDTGRCLPMVLVSELDKFMIYPEIDKDLAADLAGLANVYSLHEDASWELTGELGAEWSCFNGAIRVFWPIDKEEPNPFRHHLWTKTKLLWGVSGVDEAASRIRHQLRRMILGTSAFTVRIPAVFEDIRQEKHEEEIVARQALVRDAEDYEGVVRLYEEDKQRFKERIVALEEELEEKSILLESCKQNIDSLTRYEQILQPDEDVVEAENEVPPATAEEAVEFAMARHQGVLSFGEHVATGVAKLARTAGPPEKILKYLEVLADMSRLRRDGTLGCGMIEWLGQHNCDASSESETIRNNDREMQRRARSDGIGGHRQFHLHMKPTEATSPDQCVRIYFDWDEEKKVIIVGWVGRHP